MHQELFQIKISENIGFVSAETLKGQSVDAVMTLAHGAGAGMHHSFMMDLAQALANVNIATIRFNFPFMEHKKGRPDTPAVAHKTIEGVIQKTHNLFPHVPLFVSGKSFGGRMSSQCLANHHIDFVNGIIFYGFPLHPAGKPSLDRADHLRTVKLPMLFLQGTRDALANWELIEKTTGELPQSNLMKIEGADHSFNAGKKNLIPLLAQATKEWVSGISKQPILQ